MSAREWEHEGLPLVLKPETGEVEILVPTRGWLIGTKRYSVAAFFGGNDSAEWSVIRGRYGDGMPDEILVIKREFQQEPIDPYELDEVISCWTAPGYVDRFPEHLVGQGLDEVEAWLLDPLARPVSVSRVNVNASEGAATQTDVASIEGEVRNKLAGAARAYAAVGKFSLNEEPVAAVRTYWESASGQKLNQTVVCRWCWRLCFPVSAHDQQGFLTVEVQAMGFDASDEDGVRELGNGEPRAWLALPAASSGVTDPSPGVLLRDVASGSESARA